jgi:hypothetical protein
MPGRQTLYKLSHVSSPHSIFHNLENIENIHNNKIAIVSKLKINKNCYYTYFYYTLYIDIYYKLTVTSIVTYVGVLLI